MAYCGGILVREGLVMFADTRTNAGVDNISTFRKPHIFKDPKKRVMAIASAGNLSMSQSVVSILTEGYDNIAQIGMTAFGTGSVSIRYLRLFCASIAASRQSGVICF